MVIPNSIIRSHAQALLLLTVWCGIRMYFVCSFILKGNIFWKRALFWKRDGQFDTFLKLFFIPKLIFKKMVYEATRRILNNSKQIRTPSSWTQVVKSLWSELCFEKQLIMKTSVILETWWPIWASWGKFYNNFKIWLHLKYIIYFQQWWSLGEGNHYKVHIHVISPYWQFLIVSYMFGDP